MKIQNEDDRHSLREYVLSFTQLNNNNESRWEVGAELPSIIGSTRSNWWNENETLDDMFSSMLIMNFYFCIKSTLRRKRIIQKYLLPHDDDVFYRLHPFKWAQFLFSATRWWTDHLAFRVMAPMCCALSHDTHSNGFSIEEQSETNESNQFGHFQWNRFVYSLPSRSINQRWWVWFVLDTLWLFWMSMHHFRWNHSQHWPEQFERYPRCEYRTFHPRNNRVLLYWIEEETIGRIEKRNWSSLLSITN